MRAYLGRFGLGRLGRLGRRSERGQAIIETALLLPFIFLLILLSIEFGFMLFTDLTVEAAAHEAARAAAVGADIGVTSTAVANCGGANTIRGRAVQASAGRVRCNEVNVWNVERVGAANAIGTGDSIVVEIRHQYSPLTPGLSILNVNGGGAAPGQVLMRACADARVEKPGPPTTTEADGC